MTGIRRHTARVDLPTSFPRSRVRFSPGFRGRVSSLRQHEPLHALHHQLPTTNSRFLWCQARGEEASLCDRLASAVSLLPFSILTCQPIRLDRSLLASPCLPSQRKTGGSHMSRHTRALKGGSRSLSANLPAFPCDPTTPHSLFKRRWVFYQSDAGCHLCSSFAPSQFPFVSSGAGPHLLKLFSATPWRRSFVLLVVTFSFRSEAATLQGRLLS